MSRRPPPTASWPAAPIGGPDPAPETAGPSRVTLHALLGDGRLLIIEHAGAEYLLRLTRNHRLILTKQPPAA